MATATTTTVRALQGDTLDTLCLRHLGTTSGGTVEATLTANPGLASLGPVLPVGTQVVLVQPAKSTEQTVKLWD
jgi:phage tail protein X